MIATQALDSGRTPQACVECRRSKTKCNGRRPICQRCTRRRTPCTWPDMRRLTPEESLDETSRALPTSRASVPPPEPSPLLSHHFHADGGTAVLASLADTSLQRLLDIFLTRHHDVEFCGFLHRPTTDMATLTAQSPFLVASIASLTALYIDNDEVQRHYGKASAASLSEQLAQKALAYARNVFETPSIFTVQAFLVLSVRELLAWKDFRAWMHAGVAIRMALALHLGVECNTDQLTVRQREVRRRTFWACFVVDRLVSYSCHQPFSVSMLSARVRLPCPDAAFAFDEAETGPWLDDLIVPGQLPMPSMLPSMSPSMTTQPSQLSIAPFYISMVRLWGDMALLHTSGGRRRTKHTPTDPAGDFMQYSNAVEAFAASLPPALHWSMANCRRYQATGQAHLFVGLNFLLLHARCVMRIEYLPQLDAQYFALTEQEIAASCDAAGLPLGYADRDVVEPCMRAVDAITEIATTLHINNGSTGRVLLQSTVAAYALMTAAAAQLWVIYTQTCDRCPKDVARARFLQLLHILQTWEVRWPVAVAWAETLGMLYKLYEYSYGTEPVPEFAVWEAETGEAENENENENENADRPGLSYGDVLPDPAAICQQLHDKVRSILVHPLHAREVKKKNLRVFSQTLWQHLWVPSSLPFNDIL